MNQTICPECGATLGENETVCPSCGCPVKATNIGHTVVPKKLQTEKLNGMSILSALLGLCIIVMGIIAFNLKPNFDTYSAAYYSIASFTFGADFYTEIYGAADTMVDELNDISNSLEILSKSMETMANLICRISGMLMIALGIGVTANALQSIKKE